MTPKTHIIAEKGKQELFITREFDAPRELVYKAFSEPNLLVQWMGPKEMDTIVHKLDNRSHGSWRFSHTDPHKNTHAFNGTIHEASAPERIIRTFEYEGMPERGHVSLEFLTLENLQNNRSKMSIQVVFKSVEDRDGQIEAGMERGVVDSHERLDVLLKSL
ncbi:SRPBCC family protein [uncultured Roseivirga sp.]|uniref:SRPBCC family protein n=1 Tax=uncultured Roseivirga sp. TaxID=543088 RepID=UPI0030D86DA5|tara:strand:- start:10575 stop:11057 length:483 start_codon:yes stop_codon:yes gene_type:complete